MKYYSSDQVLLMLLFGQLAERLSLTCEIVVFIGL